MDLLGHTGWVITIHDLTAEQELEQMKQDFVSIAAHQLRTPTTTILGYLEAIRDEQLSSAQKTFVDQIDYSARQLRDLIENLLNVTRIERGTIQTNIQSTDYLKLTKQVIKDLKPHTQIKNQKVTLTAPSQPLKIHIDPLHIRQVLVNLLSNAIQYTPEKGSIIIKIEKQSQQVTTHISDTGPGIPKKSLPHLFQKFYRAPLPNRPSQSTGLGLYLAKELVNLHHGQISVESKLNHGTTFTFSLPLKPPASLKTSDKKN
jgi:signal transduction histidine kinase